LTHIGHSGKVLIMRIFISVLVLIFSFQSWTKADDIRDFEIEGISVGDSALDFFSKKEIKKNHAYDYKNKSFSDSWFRKEWFKTYDTIQTTYKLSDKKIIIYGLDGTLPLSNIECLKKQEQVNKEIQSVFNKQPIKTREVAHSYDKSGNSRVNEILFLFDNGYSRISCFDWSDKITKEKGWTDHLRVSVGLKEFGEFLKISFK